MLLWGIAMFAIQGAFSLSAQTSTIAQFRLGEIASVWDGLPQPTVSERPLPLDSLGEYDKGSVIYRTRLKEDSDIPLQWKAGKVNGLALVFVDGMPAGRIDGLKGECIFSLPAMEAGTTIEIFVTGGDSGASMSPGITGGLTRVTSSGETVELTDWRNYPVPGDYEYASSRPYSTDAPVEGPVYYRGKFNIIAPADTYLDFSVWGEGTVYVNGHCLGMFSQLNPALALPSALQFKGDNEIVVFDIIGPEKPDVRGIASLGADGRIRAGLPCELTSDMMVAEGELNGEGWKEIEFAFPVNTRYVAFEIADADDVPSLAEVRIVGPGINRVSQEGWKVAYVSSESLDGNGAENVFDMDESTRWQAEPSAVLPQTVVIDMGADFGVTGVQILPFRSSNKSGKVWRCRVYAL